MSRVFLFAVLTYMVIGRAEVSLAATWYVRQGGDDVAEGTSAGSAFRTVTRAVRALNHGDQIVIGPGTYRESVFAAERFGTTNVRVAFRGDESGKLSGDPAGPVILVSPDPSVPALHLYRMRNVVLSGLTFRGPGEGIRIMECRDVIVQRCTADRCARGIAVMAVQGLRLQSTLLTRCAIAVFLKGALDTRLLHVSIAGSSSAGVLMLTSGSGDIRNCLLVQNNSNYVADTISAPAWRTDHNVVSGDVGPWGNVPTIHNVYEWSSASGQDRHSVYVAPTFVSPQEWDLHVSPKIAWAGGLPGMNVSEGDEDSTSLDRDGKPFHKREGKNCCSAFDYPDTQPAGSWKLLGKFGGTGSRQSAGIYRTDGSLVRTLLADAAGVEQVWWDGLDDQGQPAPPGDFQLRTVAHDLRLVDDGNYGDNGNPLGTYNPDNPDRLAPLADGGFVVAVPYDEAGMPLRRFTPTGQPIAASNLAQKDFMGLTPWDGQLLGVVNKAAPELARISADGQRLPFAGGAESSPVFDKSEKASAVGGVAVIGDIAYVCVPALNLVRAIDLVAGRKKSDFQITHPADIAADGNSLWILTQIDALHFIAPG